MIKGFKDFIMQGNVIDLAVAVVIGAAFTAIVGVLVDGLINPLIGAIFQIGDLSSFVISIPTLSGNTANILVGSIIGAIINFLAVAAIVYFVFVLPMNHLKARQAARAGVPAPEAPKGPTQEQLLVQIRDLLEKQTGSSVSTTPPAP